MKNFKTIALAGFLVFAGLNGQAKLNKQDLATWPKTAVTDFGCFLEKQLGHKDEKFNCALKKYVNKGDPCLNTSEFYEGPKIPNELAKKINSKIQSIDLIWEKGRMQSLAFTLDTKYTDKEVRTLFKLATKAQVDACGPKNTCVTLTGFEAVGGDCGDE